MPYTYRSLSYFWLITFALFGVSASGAATGWWLLVLLASAVAAPALILRAPAGAITMSTRALTGGRGPA
jgi:hypothetical protein